MDKHRANFGIEQAIGRGADAGQLREIVAEAEARTRADRAGFRLALVYPAAISGLAILGMVWTTATHDRLFRDLADSFREPPIPADSSGWSAMLPTAAVLIGLSLLAAAGLAAWIGRLGRAVGRHAGRAVRCEVLAELVATDVAGADRERLAGEIIRGMEPPLPLAESASPLIEAAEHAIDIDQRAANLRATAGFYRSLDARSRRTAGRLVPIVGSLIAGLAVLLYGLALFGPMAGLFASLAQAPDPIGGGKP